MTEKLKPNSNLKIKNEILKQGLGEKEELTINGLTKTNLIHFKSQIPRKLN